MTIRKSVIRFLADHAATVESDDDRGITFHVVSGSVSDEIESAASVVPRYITYSRVEFAGEYHYHVRLRGGWEYGSVPDINRIRALSARCREVIG